MSLQAEYNALQAGHWCLPNPAFCPCRGLGWILSDLDTWHECHYHGGFEHPETELPEDPFKGEMAELNTARYNLFMAQAWSFFCQLCVNYKVSNPHDLLDSAFSEYYRSALDGYLRELGWLDPKTEEFQIIDQQNSQFDLVRDFLKTCEEIAPHYAESDEYLEDSFGSLMEDHEAVFLYKPLPRPKREILIEDNQVAPDFDIPF